MGGIKQQTWCFLLLLAASGWDALDHREISSTIEWTAAILVLALRNADAPKGTL